MKSDRQAADAMELIAGSVERVSGAKDKGSVLWELELAAFWLFRMGFEHEAGVVERFVERCR